MSEALCVTALGPAALCDAVLDAVGRLFAAEWATLVLTGGDLQSSVPSPVTWYREPGQRGRAPAVAEVAALAARITDSAQVMTAGAGAARATVLGAPMRLDHRQARLDQLGVDGLDPSPQIDSVRGTLHPDHRVCLNQVGGAGA